MATITRKQKGSRMSGIVIHGDTVYLSGLTAPNATPDVGDQTRQTLELIDQRLAEAGTDKHHILKANIWISDIRYFDAMNVAWDAWVSGDAPARATVEARLARPDLLVEIMVTAALP